jgi:hypothetical protein
MVSSFYINLLHDKKISILLFIIYYYKYNTRHKDLFKLEKHCTAKYETGLLYSAEQMHNKLPEIIRQIKEVHIFKNNIKKHLLQLNIYNIDKYL